MSGGNASQTIVAEKPNDDDDGHDEDIRNVMFEAARRLSRHCLVRLLSLLNLKSVHELTTVLYVNGCGCTLYHRFRKN